MGEERVLSAKEVCEEVGCSLISLNNWYKYKKLNPDSELGKILPEYANNDFEPGRPRYWKESDIVKILQFKNSLVRGRYGTDVYVKKD